MKEAWPDLWGPRLKYVLLSSLLWLFSLNGATSLDLHRFLVELECRQRLGSRLRDPQFLQFWHQEFATYTKTFRTEVMAPIVNKIGQYLTTPLVRHIIGRRTSAVSCRTVIDAGGIVLANLAKGRSGQDVSMLLKSSLVNQLAEELR